MYEWKAFSSLERTIESLNSLMNSLVEDGWEIVQVDFDQYSLLARKNNSLND